jgi:TonB-linked SusC/RagA family outer membrane protein
MLKKLLSIVALALVLPLSAFAQTGYITGTVTDRNTGEELTGANVFIRELSKGAVTDLQGRYEIRQVAAGSYTLAVSYIGYRETRVLVNVGTGELVANIQLDLDLLGLDDVVITALGIERDRKSLGYGAQTVSGQELTIARTTNVVNALSGKVAGVRIQASNGMVGSSSSIFIRGFTTFTQSNQPLFVVDGIPIDNSGGGNALQTGVSNSNRAIDINQDDIENITVLKGPAAAVLYGSRAASGAVIITTKKGGSRDGRNVVNYSVSYQQDDVNRYPDMQNSYGQGSTGVYNPIASTSWGPKFGTATIPCLPITAGVPATCNSASVPLATSVAAALAAEGRPTTGVYQAYPNNIKDIFQSGTNVQHNLSVSGSHNSGNYTLSYGNLKQTGVLEGNELTRHNIRFNAINQLTNKLSASASVQHIVSNSERSQIGNQLSNPMFRAWFLPRNYDIKNMPYTNLAGGNVYFDGIDNPFWTLKNNLYNDELSRTIGNVGLDYSIFDWLSVNYKMGTDFYTQTIEAYDQIGNTGSANTGAATGTTGGILNQTITSHDFYSYLNVTANRNLTQDLRLSVLVGNEVAQLRGRSNSIIGRGLSVRDFRNISNATSYSPGQSYSQTRLVGIYADVALSYRDFLTVNVTGRNDWSSTFLTENNSYFYPSVAGSFIVTEAFKGLKSDYLNFFKIRGNMATVGRTAPAYGTDTYYFGAGIADGFGPSILYPYGTLSGFTYANGAGNPKIGPEFTTSKEIGVELGVLNDRLGLDLTYYNSSTTDIILNVPISAASGNNSLLQNAGELSSKGWEVLIRATPIRTRDLRWDMSFNWSKNETTVESLANGVTSIFLGGFTTPQTRLQAGSPYGVLWGNYWLRNDAGQLQINPATGLPLFTNDAKVIGNPNPDWTGGITQSLNYKGLNVTAVIDMRKGGDLISRNVLDMQRNGAGAETAKFERFNPDGSQTTPYVIPGVYASGANAGQPNTTAITVQNYWQGYAANGSVAETYVYDGSFTRLRELSISYTVPRRMLAPTRLVALEVGVNGRNLWLSAPNYPHFDPETNAQGVSNSQGLEFNALPQTKTVGFFVRTTF